MKRQRFGVALHADALADFCGVCTWLWSGEAQRAVDPQTSPASTVLAPVLLAATSGGALLNQARRARGLRSVL